MRKKCQLSPYQRQGYELSVYDMFSPLMPQANEMLFLLLCERFGVCNGQCWQFTRNGLCFDHIRIVFFHSSFSTALFVHTAINGFPSTQFEGVKIYCHWSGITQFQLQYELIDQISTNKGAEKEKKKSL